MSDKIEQLKQWYEQEQIRIKQEFDSKLKELADKVKSEKLESLIRRLEIYKHYWFIDSFQVMETQDVDYTIDLIRFKMFNYYHTKEEAEKAQARELLARKVFLARSLARKDGKHNNEEWIPDWRRKGYYQVLTLNFDNNSFTIDIVTCSTLIYPLIFKDNNQVSIFRKYISDDEIKQFLEG